MNDAPDPRLYRPGVGIALFDRRGLVFAACRLDTPPAEGWQMPQGGIDHGETPRQAALRELTEETGITRAEIVAESQDWFHYDLPPDLARRLWRGRYRGQSQKWFALRFLGDDSDIDLAHTAHPEFSAWKWMEIDALAGIVVPFKRDIYCAVAAEFAPVARGLAAAGPVRS